jgi:hypothetical protein
MSTLTGNKISLTYKSILKTSDNDVLTGTLKQLSDGLGNNSGVYLNTGGDLKSTGTLEFANFKATAHSVTINKLVNEADGISSNDNDTSLPTSAAVKDYVDTHVTSQDLDFSDGTNVGAVDLDSQVLAIIGTSNEIETAASGQQLQIGLPNSITISGTYTGATFSGDLNGTINTATTAVTQTAGNNSTKVATTAYVDTLDAASDLDFSGTSGTGDVNLNTQTFAITGGANQITTAASNQGLVISLLSSGVTLPNNSIATTQSAGDNSTKIATTAYVDTLDAASDLDIAGDSGTGDVNLNTQTFTLSGTTNQITTAVSGQTATFSLPSTVHRNLQGNVTGNLTGNADTATKWATARNLSLTSEATGTISSVDGTQNVSGAVTLLNSAVTGKVLTGLPTPAAGNIQAGDSILEAFGKLQSQVSSISNGLIFKGSWDADTNTPTLTSGGGEVDSGTTTGQATNKLIQSGQNFNTTITVGDKVINQVDGTTALVTVIDSNTQLTLDADIMLSGEAYTIDASPFIQQGNYYVVNYAGTTNLNGNNSWSIGDWVIADADNRWSKLDHSQVDGQGTIGNLPVFATATTIGDSIVAQSGTALTVTGSLATTLGASVAGDFAVNTNKFTVNATSGTGTFAGNVTINGLVIGTDQTFAGEYRTFAFGTNANGYNRIFATKDQTDGIYLASATGHGLKVRVNGNSTNVLTIDSSGNATFAGNLTAVRGIFNSGTTNNVASFTSTDATAKLQCVDNAGLVNFGANGDDFIVQPAGGTTQFTVGSSSSTFAGNVTLSSASSPTLEITDTTNTCTFKAYAQNSNAHIGTMTNHSLVIDTNGSSALTIDSSQNATFAGDVQATGIYVGATNASFDFYNQGTSYFNGAVTVDAAFTQSGGGASTFSGKIITTALQPSYDINYYNVDGTISSYSASNYMYVNGLGGASGQGLRLMSEGAATNIIGLENSNNSIFFNTNSALALTLDSSQNATFAGDVSSSGTSKSLKYWRRLWTDANNDWGLNNNAGTGVISVSGMGTPSTSTTTFAGNITSNGASTVNTGGSIAAYFNGTGSSYTQGAIAIQSSNADSPEARGQGVFMFNQGKDTTWYMGTRYNDADDFIIGRATGVALNTEAARTNNEIFNVSNSAEGHIRITGTAPILKAYSGNQSSGFRIQVENLDQSTDTMFRVQDGSTTKFQINKNGYVGIDEGSPGTLLSLKGAADTSIITLKCTKNDSSWSGERIGGINFFSEDGSGAGAGIRGSINYIATSSSGGSTAMTFKTGDNSERMRITNDGDVEITGGYATSTAFQTTGALRVLSNSSSNNGNVALELLNDATGTRYLASFANNNGVVGSISTLAFATTYNTSSDYRLKEDLQDFKGLDKISKISVYDFKWKTDESRSYGVMAHELQEVLPQAVVGEKDAEEMQGVDYSKIVPLLVKSIQELKAEVDLLKQECKCK